jgi:hypothetical protein
MLPQDNNLFETPEYCSHGKVWKVCPQCQTVLRGIIALEQIAKALWAVQKGMKNG